MKAEDNGVFAVLGAGSWGTALADMLGRKGFKVRLWARSAELCGAIASTRENSVYLPGVALSENIAPCASIDEALDGADMVVSAVPSHGLRGVFSRARPFILKDAVIVSATKGIEQDTLLTPSGILRDALKGAHSGPVVALSGPSFAKEVAEGLPTAVCAASESTEAAEAVQRAFSTQYFRVYTNSDVTGVELGGALKNVIAIASGISDGLKLGANARAALITRGLAEMSRMGARMGASPQTFYGLSGLGDLVLTCTGALSRNYTVGLEIGRGRSLDEIVGSMRMVAEGVKTSVAAEAMAAANGVEMPITEAVCAVLNRGESAQESVLKLMTRELKSE